MSADRRIAQQARLDDVCLRHAEPLVGGLKARVVEERDLHRRGDIERLAEELANVAGHLGVLVSSLVPVDAGDAALMERPLDIAKPRPSRNRAAAERADRRQRKQARSLHRLFSTRDSFIPHLGQ